MSETWSKRLLVFISSTHYSRQMFTKFEFCRQIFERCSDIKFCQNPSSGSRVVPYWRTDRRDKASSRFSKLRSNNTVVRVPSLAPPPEPGMILPCFSCAVLSRVQRNEIQVPQSCKSAIRKSHTAHPTPIVNIRWQHTSLNKRETTLLPAGLKPAIPASERSHTHALDPTLTQGSARVHTQAFISIH
jgi:hypothetical protein